MSFRGGVLFAAFCGSVSAQTLRITSPRDGTVVHPGDSVKVMVEATGKFQMVMIIGTRPIGGSMPLSAPPYDLFVKIPENITPDKYLLTAVGAALPGHSTNSEPVVVIVERAEPFHLLLKVRPAPLRLTVGRRESLRVFGDTPEGYTIDLNPTGQLSFTSDAPEIARVDAGGNVTGVAPGTARITVTCAKDHVDVPVTVEKSQ